MWLPKEERYLLMFYTASDPDFHGQARTFSLDGIQWLMTKRLRPKEIIKRAIKFGQEKNNDTQCTYQEADRNVNPVKRYLSWLRAKTTIESANNRLRERGLIEAHECGTGFYQIKMKLAGWELGDKYNHWFTRTGLWFEEYKHHWIWLILSFLGGIIGALIVNWLSDGAK